jgi:hypothetical protein
MRKLFSKRPSPALIISMIALIAALGGTAYAAKKITYKTLDKDARLKVLPFSKSQTSTAQCNPTAAATYTDCLTLSVNGSTGFPRKYYISFDGTFDGDGGQARGDCRLESDNAPIAGTTIRVDTPTHQADHGDGYGINVITPPLGGVHTLSVACNETNGDVRVHQYQLSAFQVR